MIFRNRKKFYFGNDRHEKEFQDQPLLYFLKKERPIKMPRKEFFQKNFPDFVPLKFFLLVFIIFGLFSPLVSAQNFSFDLVRTEESPGFFRVEIFPSPHSQPMDIQDIYVKNYNNQESEKYTELMSILSEIGSQVIDFSEIGEYMEDPRVRLIFLGNPYEDHLFFRPTDSTMAIEEFEQFSRRKLGPVYAQDISADFGGNIVDVYPKKIKYLGNQPERFVGKFRRPMKTLMEIQGLSAEGAFNATAPVQLQSKIFAQSPASLELPDDWEAYWKDYNAPEIPQEYWDPRWLTYFPWALGGLGGLLIILALLIYFKKHPASQSNNSPKFYNMPPAYPRPNYENSPPPQNPPPQTPSAPPTPFDLGPNAPKSDLPFEIEKRVQENLNR